MKTFLLVKLGLAPLAIFWALLAYGAPGGAIATGFSLSVAAALWRRTRGETFLLEIGGLVTLAALAALWFVDPVWTAANALWMSFAGLGVASFLGLAMGRPWTADYARSSFAASAGSRQFFLVNAAMSGLWGALFLAIAAARYAQLSPVVVTAIVGGGALVSIFGPRAALRLAFNRMRRGREEFHWPAPALKQGDRDCDVAIVGAGIGGLTAAALLADAGYKTIVFDQHIAAGGYCHTYLRKARHEGHPCLYRFDAGPHDFSGVWKGGPIDRILERLGVADRLEWRRIDHSYRMADGAIDPPRDWRAYARMLGERFPAEAAGLMRVFETLHGVFEGMYATGAGRGGVPGAPATLEEMLAFPADHPLAFEWMDKPFDELVAQNVRDERARAILGALTGYLGDGSERLSCAQMAPIFGYYFKGGYYPVGGSGALSDALVAAIETRGGQVRLKTPVSEIIVENGRAAGVKLADGARIRANAVISNADLRRTFLELVAKEHTPADFRARIEKAAPATSCFSVHLGLDYVPDIRPSTHVAGPLHVGAATMSLLDPSAAPPGHSIMMLIMLMPFEEARKWFPDDEAQGFASDWKQWRRSDEYEQRKTGIGDRMIATMESVLPDLSRHIVYRADASPVTYARYDWASGGAIYGISPQGRLKGSKSPIPGLLIAGGGNYGAGVEAVAISGAEAAEALAPGLLAGATRRG